MKKGITMCVAALVAFYVCAEQKPNASVSLCVTSRLPIFPGEGCSGVFTVKNTGEVPFVVVSDEEWSAVAIWFYREGNEEQQRIEEKRGYMKQWKERGRAAVASDYKSCIAKNKATNVLQPNESITFNCKKFYFDGMPGTPSTFYKAEMYLGNDTWVPVEISPPIGYVRHVSLRESRKDNVFVYAQEGTNQFLYLLTNGEFERISEMKLGSQPEKWGEDAVMFDTPTGVKKRLTLAEAKQAAQQREQQNQPERFETPEEEANRLRGDFKDAVKLKKYISDFLFPRSCNNEERLQFKQRFGVDDRLMQTALIDIHREIITKAGHVENITWNSQDLHKNDRHRFVETIRWLGICADADGKNFLMGIATEYTNDSELRYSAIFSYLLRTDAQEARDVLVRLLTGDIKAESSLIHSIAIQVHGLSEGDAQKREALTSAIAIALAREENKALFILGDDLFAKQSKEYAESSQRLAMLERMGKQPPAETPRPLPVEGMLKASLESFKSRTAFTSVSTNLTELMARDFRK